MPSSSFSPTEPTSLVDVTMPAMGTSIAEATLVAWTRQIGDPVVADETLCEISTDKVDSEYPSPVTGVLAEILIEAGETVEVGTVLGRIAASGSQGNEQAPQPTDADESSAATSEVQVPAGSVPRRLQANGRYYSPVVRRIAERYGLDLDKVPGSGRSGRVTKRDALAAVEVLKDERPLHSESPYRHESVTEPAMAISSARRVVTDDLGGRPERLSRVRIAIGAAMLRSQAQAATAHTVVECDMTSVEIERRKRSLTALPIVAATTIEVLRGFPDLNATLDEDVLTRYDRVHLGVAVSLGPDGLIVPVIRDAQDLSPAGLSASIRDLAQRARTNALVPSDVQGATFTITSPGAAGALIATPIIDVPQVAILDLEAIVRRPVVIGTQEEGESVAIRSVANLVLGWDHRAIDGMYAAQFLTALRRRLEAVHA